VGQALWRYADAASVDNLNFWLNMDPATADQFPLLAAFILSEKDLRVSACGAGLEFYKNHKH
jgi:hypothetical protein